MFGFDLILGKNKLSRIPHFRRFDHVHRRSTKKKKKKSGKVEKCELKLLLKIYIYYKKCGDNKSIETI